ncbi:MAG: NAD(P)H-dependent oxidoreductase [Phycisphaerae bacterium]|nr:NAD(P)H-dependent oxidoreductase [Phycisphaerae bacterium]
MRITVLNGSPKGKSGVTIQSVRYLQKMLPEHDFNIIHVSKRIKGIESNVDAFSRIVEEVRASDGVLWAFPLYFLLVPSQYKRFIELIYERNAQSAFAGKYTAALTTSIHFYDHTAHRYMHAVCDDLNMHYTGAFSGDLMGLLEAGERGQLVEFGRQFITAIEQHRPTARRYLPPQMRNFEYQPARGRRNIDPGDLRILVLSDGLPEQLNLNRMVAHFRASYTTDVEVVNIHDLHIVSGCVGCLQCGYSNACALAARDDYVDFYREKVIPADVIIIAGSLRDRYLSARWKMFFDRSFFMGHRPTWIGKQVGFIISGPMSYHENLREIFEGYAGWQQCNIVDFVSDEHGSSAEIDACLNVLADRVATCARQSYIAPATFLGVGARKVFRDEIWGRLRIAFLADHRVYKTLGLFDFPQRDMRVRLLSAVGTLGMSIPPVREKIQDMLRQGVSFRHRRVVDQD